MYGRVARRRIAAWWLLGLSSLPIHFIYNAAMFKSASSTLYYAAFATDSFIHGEPATYNTTIDSTWTSDSLAIFSSWPINSTSNPMSIFNRSSEISNISTSDCIDLYADQTSTGASLLLITHDNEHMQKFNFRLAGNNPKVWQKHTDVASNSWMCSQNQTVYNNSTCDSAQINATDWHIEGIKVDYRLSQLVTGQCQLIVSYYILAAVVVCNALKVAVVLWTLYATPQTTLVTIGDTIASFLDHPFTTPGASQTLRSRLYFLAIPKVHWMTTLMLYIAALTGLFSMLVTGTKQLDPNGDGVSGFGKGFGGYDGVIDLGTSNESTTSYYLRAVLLTNTPQVLFTLIYFVYNSLVTRVLVCLEWNLYYLRKKGLRVTDPHGHQRSTYFLSLPYRYSIPMLAAGALMHWLISQSLFMVLVTDVLYVASGPQPLRSYSQAVYSCTPMIFAILLAFILAQALSPSRQLAGGPKNVLLFLGGLGAGLASLDLLPKLSASLPCDWSLVQVLSRSSYKGFLSAGIDDTAEDLRQVELYLQKQAGKNGRLVVIGCSAGVDLAESLIPAQTGANEIQTMGNNDVLRFFEIYGEITTIDSAVLLVPTGGRENVLRYMTEEQLSDSLAVASKQIESGKGAFPLPSEWYSVGPLQGCVGMHAQVWYSIMATGGPAENFCSTSSDEQLMKLFESIRKHGKSICIMTAENDEAVPDMVDKRRLMERMLHAASGDNDISCGYVVPGTGHDMKEENAQDFIIEKLVMFLQSS